MTGVDPEAHGQFLAALRAATIFMPGRERTKTNCVKLVQEIRIRRHTLICQDLAYQRVTVAVGP